MLHGALCSSISTSSPACSKMPPGQINAFCLANTGAAENPTLGTTPTFSREKRELLLGSDPSDAGSGHMTAARPPLVSHLSVSPHWFSLEVYSLSSYTFLD